MTYDVHLIDTGYKPIDYVLIAIQIITFLASLITIGLLIYNTHKQHMLEKVKLIITPKKKVANSRDEIFYLYLAFSNESALPISILDLRVNTIGERGTFHTSSGIESGIIAVDSINVVETDRVNRTVKTDYKVSSITVPFTIEPYSVFSGYFAFHESGQSSFTICNKEIELFITTSRKTFKIQMDLNPSNFYETSYRDDGLMFGRNVYGKAYQDTSIRPDRC